MCSNGVDKLSYKVTVWLNGSALASINSFSASGPVSTGMGDHLPVGKPSQ